MGRWTTSFTRSSSGARASGLASARPAAPDIEKQPVQDISDLRSVPPKSATAGVINQYHHVA